MVVLNNINSYKKFPFESEDGDIFILFAIYMVFEGSEGVLAYPVQFFTYYSNIFVAPQQIFLYNEIESA